MLSYGGFEDVYFASESATDTVMFEIAVTYVMVILILTIHIRNIKTTVELITKLLKLTNFDGFHYEALENQVSRELLFFSALIELAVIYLIVINFYWIQQESSFLIFHILRNVIITAIISMPVSLVSNVSICLSFCIDFLRQFVIFMNKKVSKALELATCADNFKELSALINEIEQLYGTTLNIIKLFERSYEWIIVITQCGCMCIGINQVG